MPHYKMKIFQNPLIKTKNQEVLEYLKKRMSLYGGKNLYSNLDVCFSHTWIILRKFQDMELITIERVGRANNIKITKKGIEVAHLLDLIRKYSDFKK